MKVTLERIVTGVVICCPEGTTEATAPALAEQYDVRDHRGRRLLNWDFIPSRHYPEQNVTTAPLLHFMK